MTVNRPELVRALPADLVLAAGSHESPAAGMCVMEAVAYVAGEDHTDSPACACPVIATFMRGWNDSIPDDARRTELLAPLVPRLVGSRRTAAVEQRRAALALDWFVRVHTPAWLALTDTLRPHAAAIRGLAPLTSAAACRSAQITLDEARSAGAAAWDAAEAARDAAARAARDAARAAARVAAWGAAGDVAWDAACDVAWAAAWGAAGVAAGGAALDASTAALHLTVAALQSSALVLVDRMLAVTDETTEAEFEALADWPTLDNER